MVQLRVSFPSVIHRRANCLRKCWGGKGKLGKKATWKCMFSSALICSFHLMLKRTTKANLIILSNKVFAFFGSDSKPTEFSGKTSIDFNGLGIKRLMLIWLMVVFGSWHSLPLFVTAGKNMSSVFLYWCIKRALLREMVK